MNDEKYSSAWRPINSSSSLTVVAGGAGVMPDNDSINLNFSLMETQKSGLTAIAEVTIGYSTNVPVSEMQVVKSSGDAARILRPFFENFIQHHEAFYVMFLNRGHKVLGVMKLSEGGMSGTVVDQKMLFQAALLAHASAVILAHNHPGGSLEPSDMDLNITKRIVKSGQLLDMTVLDHIILTAEGYYSFADEGKL